MSISTTSSSSIVAPWRTWPGKWSTSPAVGDLLLPSIVKRTRPRSTSVICSCGCEWTAVTTWGAKSEPADHQPLAPDHLPLDALGDPLAGDRGPVRCGTLDGIPDSHFFSDRPLSSPEPIAANSGWTLTTPYWRSSSSRLAAIIHRKLIDAPGAATFG